MSRGAARGAGGVAGGGGGEADVDDAMHLSPLNEDTMLHYLHSRFLRDQIYSWCGGALVSVNGARGHAPGRTLPLYSAELARRYLAAPPHLAPPHLYAVAADAYRWVRDRAESQCIVITGESGSGKTEAARVCLQCVVLAAAAAEAGRGAGRGAAAGAGRGAALVAAGTVLEAFGNAATVRNHNASRFGKLLDMEIDIRGRISSAHITHYLLEKGRAAGAPAGERNYHVLYQLLAAADPGLLKRLRLQRSWQHYHILRAEPRGGGEAAAERSEARADTDHFTHTARALATVGIEAEEVWRVLAFILHLGNVTFTPEQCVDGGLTTRVARPAVLRDAANAVGLCPAALTRALGADRTMDAEADDNEDALIEEDGGASWTRDSIIETIYARLFTWLVATVNESLRGDTEGGATLAILDMYGWESLADNGLERLLINYCGERVQAALDAAVRAALTEAAREGVCAPAPLPPSPAELCAAALDSGPAAVLALARDCAADEDFVPRLQRARPARVTALPPMHFRVCHFAGSVTYSARGLARRSRDALPPRALAVLASSSCPLLALLFHAPAPHIGSPRHRSSLAGRQRALVAALAARLAEQRGVARRVRCLRAAPAPAPAPHALEPRYLRAQILAHGIVEATAVCAAGWFWSVPVSAALQRYWPILCCGEARQQARGGNAAALRALPLRRDEYTLTRNTLCHREPRTVWLLEWWWSRRVQYLVLRVQRCWRARSQRRRRAARVVARTLRRARALRERRAEAARVLSRWWVRELCARYLRRLRAQLPPAHRSPACRAWPAPPPPRLRAAHHALRDLHHRARCYAYRLQFDQTARNRMREKVTASALFLGRKAGYAASVPHPFVGDYVRLRAAHGWRRGHGATTDRYLVFADTALRLTSGKPQQTLLALSTAALLLLDPRSLRVRRRVPAANVHALALSPRADRVLAIAIREPPSTQPPQGSNCLALAGSSTGDLLVDTRHTLELATKLFLVVQNVRRAPHVHISDQFEVTLSGESVTVSFHGVEEGGAAGGEAGAALGGGARLLRRGDRLLVLAPASAAQRHPADHLLHAPHL